MDPILALAYIAIVLMVGVMCTFVAKELKLPYNLILILLGLFLGSLFYSGSQFVKLDKSLILGVGTLALVLLVFDSASRLRFKENSLEALPTIKFINLFTLMSVLIVSLFTAYAFFYSVTLSAVLYSLLLAVLIVETDLGSVLLLFKDFAKERAKHMLLFLETEANLNTAFVIVLPFVVLSLMRNIDLSADSLGLTLLSRLPEFLYEILIALGMGVVIGLILLRVMRDWYDEHFTPIALVTAALIAYVFTGFLGGNGVIAVAVMGFFYGNAFVSGREQLTEFSQMLSSALEILVFVMLGMAVALPISVGYIILTLLLFLVILCVRLLAVFISLKDDLEFTLKEKLFIALNMPKGVALAAVILVLSTYGVYELNLILGLAVMIMIYSIVLSFVLDFYSHKFLVEKEAKAVKHQVHHHGINVLDAALEESLIERKKPKKKEVKRSAKRKAPVKKARPSPKKKAVARVVGKASVKRVKKVSRKKKK